MKPGNDPKRSYYGEERKATFATNYDEFWEIAIAPYTFTIATYALAVTIYVFAVVPDALTIGGGLIIPVCEDTNQQRISLVDDC